MKTKAWAVHIFTASGVLAGVLALQAAWQGQIRMAFLWMLLAVFIDSVDGTLARRYRVHEHAAEIDGRRLDDMVDYFTWVIVPLLALVQWGMLHPLLVAPPLICSALGMAHCEAKTEDDCFRGFPSLWNVVAFYLWRWDLGVAFNGGLVFTLALCVLLPFRCLYPSKSPLWPRLDMALGGLWGALVAASLWCDGEWSQRLFWWSNFYPPYYLLASMWLHWKRENGRSQEVGQATTTV